jgi:hypothetical protein
MNWNIYPTDWELNKQPFEHKQEATEINHRAHSLLNTSLYGQRNKHFISQNSVRYILFPELAFRT